MRIPRTLIVSLALAACTVAAHAQNTSQLSENGWFSDDTRADGFGTEPVGTNLISPTLTDDPEAGASGTATHDADIQRQITFGAAPGTVPAGTHRGAVHYAIGAGAGGGKSQITDRKDDGLGHATGAAAFGPGMTAEYSWMGDGTVSVTASVKFGVKTADFGSTGVSSRTGENVWDKVMIYEPGNLNGGTSDGLWHTETIDYTTGKWWFFDRTVPAGTIGTPMTLSDMSTSPVLVGGGPKTIADVYALITAPGAHITSTQFGIGSGNAGGSVFVNQLETNFYRSGSTTSFGGASLLCDQDVTSNAIFGSGNDNGSWTVDRNAGVEIGLRAKTRFPVPLNVFNSNGDGTYTYTPGAGGGGSPTPLWTMEWSVNTDFDTSSGDFIGDLTYELGMDFDAGPGVNYLVFDPISIGSVIPYTPPTPPVPFWDHSIGDNSTAQGAGTEAGDAPTYAGLVAANNLVQNSWRMDFFDEFPFDVFDPEVNGRYEFYLAAFKGGDEVARSAITVIVERPLEFDQNVTNNAIFGSGNDNGSFTTDRNASVEVGLRAKTRFPVPMNEFNSNGDGTYTFPTGAGGGGSPTPLWTMEWSANTDFDGGSGDFIADLTYELGMDFDSTAGTNYLVFDPISIGSVIPFTPPDPPKLDWDHSIGTNATAQGAGTEATNAAEYAALVVANNLVQNSWRMDFFDDFPFDIFDPAVAGRYEFYLAAFDGGTEVARSAITVLALDGSTLTLEGASCQSDQDCNEPGVQIEVELWARNLASDMTGFQAFLDFDDLAMTYEGALSSYTGSPFPLHIQSAAGAEVAAGELRLDGSVAFVGPTPTDADTLLATLVFTVNAECTPATVDFDLTQGFDSEVSLDGVPLTTALVGSPSIVPDNTPPVMTCPADITVSADAGVLGGCNSAVVNFATPTATDSCTAVTVECFPPSGTAFPSGETTTVTCVATDACGNLSTCTFDVTVTQTNTVCLDVQLVGVTTPTSRCIHFVLNSCGATVDVTLDFDGTGLFSGEIEVPCGSWSTLCAKDEQHTQWDTTTLAVSGTKYVTGSVLELEGGDTDNDGDVDINDITWFLFQFGLLADAGGCPWDGTTRDADFSNNGAVGSDDYVFLTANWLTMSSCSCTVFLTSMGDRRIGAGQLTVLSGVWQGLSQAQIAGAPVVSLPTIGLPPRMRSKLDRDSDGVVDFKDVRSLELLYGLPHTLSAKMEALTPGR